MLQQIAKYVKAYVFDDESECLDNTVLSVRLGYRTPHGQFDGSLSTEFYSEALHRLQSYDGWDRVTSMKDQEVVSWEHEDSNGLTVRDLVFAENEIRSWVVNNPINLVWTPESLKDPAVFRIETRRYDDLPAIAKVSTRVCKTIHYFDYREWTLVLSETTTHGTKNIAVLLREPHQYLRRVGVEQCAIRAATSLAAKINGLFESCNPIS